MHRAVDCVQACRCRYGRTAACGLILTLSLSVGTGAVAESGNAPGERPAIGIIIDDLGYRRLDGLRAIELPGPVAYAILPHTPYGSRLATIAYQLDKEVLLHVPMESALGKALGPGALTNGMARAEVEAVLETGLASVPHVSGINNHMGSLLTREQRVMGWVMEWMSENGNLYFVDSLTSSNSVALDSARNAELRSIARDVFLDTTPEPSMIRRQFEQLLALARARGTGLAIGHPYPQTLAVLRELLSNPSRHGVELVPVRELIERRSRTPQAPASNAQFDGGRANYAHSSPTGN
jgi:polysaccharide deacetylase 2 family uncharacterized protein YibQ